MARKRHCRGSPAVGPPAPCSHPRPLDSRQQTPARHAQIRQAARDEEPIGILRQPAVVGCGPPKEPLDHQEHMFDFGTAPRLGAIAGARCLAQGPMAMGLGLDPIGGTGGVVPGHAALPALPAIGRIAPRPRLLATQQLGQHLTVMHIGGRSRH